MNNDQRTIKTFLLFFVWDYPNLLPAWPVTFDKVKSMRSSSAGDLIAA